MQWIMKWIANEFYKFRNGGYVELKNLVTEKKGEERIFRDNNIWRMENEEQTELF